MVVALCDGLSVIGGFIADPFGLLSPFSCYLGVTTDEEEATGLQWVNLTNSQISRNATRCCRYVHLCELTKQSKNGDV